MANYTLGAVAKCKRHIQLLVHHLGLLDNGIGGGEGVGLPSTSGFLGGGGGALFLSDAVGVSNLAGARTVSFPDGTLPFAALPLTLFATSYFVFNKLAFFHPAATWSPCRSRKLFAVEAVAFASASETEYGSLRNELAVFKAACFCAKEVPCAGESRFCDLVDILENLDWSSLNWGPWALQILLFEPSWFFHGFASWDPPPIPKPGTETPADPSLFKDPWLI